MENTEDPGLVQLLQQLPAALTEAVVARLPRAAKQSLRLTCKASQALVDAVLTQLTVTRAGPFKGGLAARMPRLKALQLDGVSTFEFNYHEPAYTQLASGGPWLSLTSLGIMGMSAAAVSAVVASCPNVRRLKICGVQLVDGLSSCGYDNDDGTPAPHLAVVRTICARLPSLTSLIMSDHLGGAELSELSGCASLESLQMMLSPVSASGWDAFMGLQVRSLITYLGAPGLPPGCWESWQFGMTALTALTLMAFGARADYQWPLFLPPSLVRLDLHQCPGCPVSSLPNLTHLTMFEATPQHLALLARMCTALQHVDCGDQLVVAADCHAAPFHALTRLVAPQHFGLDKGTQLATIYPALQVLRVPGICIVLRSSEVSWLHGATALTELSIGTNGNPDDEFVMGPGEFAALAAASTLRRLECYAEPHHVHLLGSLVTLRSITWRLASGQNQNLVRALTGPELPPPQLNHAIIVVEDTEHHQRINILSDFQPLPPDLIAALVGWLLRAPALKHVVWDNKHDLACASLSDASLFALAAHPFMEYIEVAGHNDGITSAMVQRIRRMHAGRGLRIVCFGLDEA